MFLLCVRYNSHNLARVFQLILMSYEVYHHYFNIIDEETETQRGSKP